MYNLLSWLDSVNYLPGIISSYLTNTQYVYDVGVFHSKTIQQIIMVIVLIVLFGANKQMPTSYNLLFNTYYLSTVFYVTFSEISLFAFRFGGNFNSVEPILITYIIVTFRQRRMIANIITVFSLIMAYYNYVIVKRIPDYEFLISYPL